MSSPVQIPFRSLVQIDPSSKTPVFLQIARGFIQAIQKGVLASGTRLPGTRQLSQEFRVHRKTVVAAFDELATQGWIDTFPNKGSFICGQPEPFRNLSLPAPVKESVPPSLFNYKVRDEILLDAYEPSPKNIRFVFHDGNPDTRLTPSRLLARTFGSILRRKRSHYLLDKGSPAGNDHFREVLAQYLNQSRGIPLQKDNIITTRGTNMGIYLSSAMLLGRGDSVVCGTPGYYIGNMIFQQSGARIQTIPVDENGIRTDHLESICLIKPPRMVYVTPHHHYPTTVTLSTERRIHLLNLAARFGFIILEDDSDYDFHYQSAGLLPLASASNLHQVIYLGSFEKSLAPGIQSGYIVVPDHLAPRFANFRQIIDGHSDTVLEEVLAELISEKEIERHLKKSLKVYKERRNGFSYWLQYYFGTDLSYREPSGGLSFWIDWNTRPNLLKLSKKCAENGLFIPQHLLFQSRSLSATRIGFGSMNPDEMRESLMLLRDCFLG